MKVRLFNPGALFVTALVLLVLAIPLAQNQFARAHNEDLQRAFMKRTG